MIVGHIGVGAAGGYEIEKSLRFRASASASLSFTPVAAGNRRQLMRRFRIKRGALGTLQVIHSAGTASIDRFYFNASNQLCLDVLGTARLVTNALFRDPSAHMVDVGFFLDVANGTAALRAGIIVDGVEVSSYATDGRASITNTDTNWNNTVVQYIGRDNAGNYFDGYISEPVGATTVTAYSELNPDNLRIPVAPVCTYGTNGFYLPFNDGTNLTELCRDRSGNSNHWTANNISLTAGATYDWVDDTPTNNFAVLNPVASSRAQSTVTEGNLRFTGTSASLGNAAVGSVGVITGKWYWEVTVATAPLNPPYPLIGIISTPHTWLTSDNFGSFGRQYEGGGSKRDSGAATAYGASYTTNDVIGVALDLDAGEITFFKNGVSQGVAFTGLSGEWMPYMMNFNLSGTGAVVANFGQRPFDYTPPAGFKALCTKNLPLGGSITTSGSFTGNVNADGPCVWLNGDPVSMTINGNAVTWGTHADRTAGGFKVRTSSASYNASGTNNYIVTITGNLFGDGIYAPNTAKGNP